MAQTIKDVLTRFTADMKGMRKAEKGFDEINKKVEKSKTKVKELEKTGSKSFGNLSNSIKQVGMTLGVALGAAVLVNMGKNFIEMTARIERGFAQVNTVAQLSDVRMKALQDRIMKMAASSTAELEPVPEALFNIVSATGDVALSEEIMEQSLKAAQTGFADLNTTAMAGVGILNAVGKANTNITEVYDVLFKTQKEGVLSFAELSMELPRIIPTAKVLGLSFEETAGALAAMTKAGISANRSATILDATFRGLSDPAKAKNLEKLGVQLFDNAGKVRPFAEVMKDINKELDGLTDKEKAARLKSIGLEENAIKGVAIMAENFETLDQVTNSVIDSQGEMQIQMEASRNASDNLKEVTNTLKVGLMAFASSIIDFVNPALEAMVDANKEAVKQQDLHTAKLGVLQIALGRTLTFREKNQIAIMGFTKSQEKLIETEFEVWKAKKKKTEATEEDTEETDKNTDAVIEQIRNLAFLKAEIKTLTAEQNKTTTSIARVKEITEELNKLTAERTTLLGKETEAEKKRREEFEKRAKGELEYLEVYEDDYGDLHKKLRKIDLKTVDIRLEGIDEVADREEEAFEKAEKRAEDWVSVRQKAAETLIEIAQIIADTVIEIDRIKDEQDTARLLTTLDTETNIKLADLNKLREQELITEKEFDKRKLAIEETAIAEEDKIKKEAFDREKERAIKQVNINLALGIAKELTKGFILALPGIAIITAEALAQKAIIRAQEFAKGGIDIKGGVKGKDSIPAVLTPGESVMTAAETREHKPLFEAIRAKKLDDYVQKQLMPQFFIKKSKSFADNLGRSLMNDKGIIKNLKKNQVAGSLDTDRVITAINGLKKDKNRLWTN